MKLVGLVLGLLLGNGAYAQIAAGSGGLDAGQGVLTEERGILQMQTTCPQRVGDAWGLVNERAWNIFEIGVQVPTTGLQDPKFQVYTRYTCETPLDQPRRGNFER